MEGVMRTLNGDFWLSVIGKVEALGKRKEQGGRNEEGEEEYERGKKDNDTNGPSKSRDYNDRTREAREEVGSWKAIT